MKFGNSILRKISKMVATRCHILKLNAPNSIYSAPPDHLAGFKGEKGLEGRAREGGERRGGDLLLKRWEMGEVGKVASWR